MKKKIFFFECNIWKSFNDRNGKKYLELELSHDDSIIVCKEHINSSRCLKTGKIMNPLEDNILEVKIPFRYNRVSCKVYGDKTVQELVKGDKVEVELEYTGVWNVGEWCGFSWKLNQVVLATKADLLTQ
jgi:hypothetical protein